MSGTGDQDVDIEFTGSSSQGFGITKRHDLVAMDHADLEGAVLEGQGGRQIGGLVKVSAHSSDIVRNGAQIFPGLPITDVPRTHDLSDLSRHQ